MLKHQTTAKLALVSFLASALPAAQAQLAQPGAVTQYAAAGTDNSTAIIQDGAGLHATVGISGSSNGGGGDYNLIMQSGEGSSASVSIEGDRNSFRVLQTAGSGIENNTAVVGITGSDNAAFISQINDLGGPYSNAAYIQQLGNFNTGSINQDVEDGVGAIVYGASNTGVIYQIGDENYAEIQQKGTGNQATIEQDGYRNFGSVTQNGAGSSLYLSQAGDYNSYVMSQTGCLVSDCPAIEVYQGVPGGGAH